MKLNFTILFHLLFLSSFSLKAQQDAIKVACVGNSVTYGYGLEERSANSYPAQLQKLLGDRYTVENFGHSGATLLKKGHNPYFKTNAFKEAIAFEPDIAIIHLGLNDTDPRNWPHYKDDFEADYTWLLDTLKKVNPDIKLFISKMTPIFNGHPRFKSGTRDWFWEIQTRIPAIVEANEARLIDLHTALYNRPDLFEDNLHPDREGAQIIAQTVYQNISGDFGGLSLPAVFNDHMVLQREKPIVIYGTANAGDQVAVTFNNQKREATTDRYGYWQVEFPAMQHGGPYQIDIKEEDTLITLRNILVGDVWLCSGQSNMDFPLKSSENGSTAIQNVTDDSSLRLYKLATLRETVNTGWDSVTLKETNRLNFFSGSWKTASPKTAADFSAIGYYFGKKIMEEEGVPVGLIQVAVGGSPIASWIDRYSLEHDPVLVDILSNWRTSDFIMPWVRERAGVNLQYTTRAKQRHPYEPCYNYEAGIKPLIRFPIKGVIWYQGESDTHNNRLYERLFTTMVSSWREKWGYDFPFYYVQLSSIARPSWPYFRNTQRKLLQQIPHSGMAVSLDLGDSLNVHPIKKEEVADRLARLALRYTYDQPVEADGPVPLQAVQDGGNIVISFSFAEQLSTAGKKPLVGFRLVTEKGKHITGKATIKNNQVYIPVSQGARIKKVLYAWEPFTRANLVNEAGLPVSTFSLQLSKGAREKED